MKTLDKIKEAHRVGLRRLARGGRPQVGMIRSNQFRRTTPFLVLITGTTMGRTGEVVVFVTWRGGRLGAAPRTVARHHVIPIDPFHPELASLQAALGREVVSAPSSPPPMPDSRVKCVTPDGAAWRHLLPPPYDEIDDGV